MSDKFAEDLKKRLKCLFIDRIHEREIVVYDEATAESVMKQAKRALLQGCSITYPDSRTTVWYSNDWVTTKEKPHEPIWNKDGERIRKARYEIIRDDTTQTVTKRKIGEFWGKYLEE